MKTKKAFTIIELMLAMSFLGTMLLGIATLIMQITNIYQKGLAIRGVNTVGREIISDLTRTVEASRVNVDINPSSNKPVRPNEIDSTDIRRARANYFVEVVDEKQMGGAFCTGSYSYVWNTAENIRKARAMGSYTEGKVSESDAKALYDNTDHVLVIQLNDGTFMVPKLARFMDNDRNACLHEDDGKTYPMKGDPNNPIKKGKTLFVLSDYGAKDVNELIEENEADLVLYDFSVLPATQNYTTKQIFYTGTFILATYRGGVNIASNGDFCQGSDSNTGEMDKNSDTGETEYTGNDFDYCAVNKFNFAIRATGETGINQHGEN